MTTPDAAAAAAHATSTIAAVRGAITVPANSAAEIRAATTRLLTALIDDNRLEPSRIVSAIFTATPDLDADFPAHAARALGWSDVPLLCAKEIPVPGAMPRVIRVLLTVRGVAPGARLAPAYLDGAARLRPDLGVDGKLVAADQAGPPDSPQATDDVAPRVSPAAADRASARVALIGLGQIGGSIGLALGQATGWSRVGFDVDPRAVTLAQAGGAIDESAPSLAAACAGAALAVVAVPVDVMAETLDAVTAALPRGAALIDTGSAREGVTPALERAAARGIAAVGGHPIAGSEGSGFAAARADLFRGATFALCPTDGAAPEPVLRLIAALGATPRLVAPAAHDRALARSSHLPYLIASALEALGREAAKAGLSGPGFRDMTRLAASDPRVALAYCRANAREVTASWHELRAALDARVGELGEDQSPPTGTTLSAAT